MEEESYLPIREASIQSGIPERTVRRWARSGRVQSIAGEHGQLVRLIDLEAAARHSGRPVRRPRPATPDAAIESGRGGQAALAPLLDAEHVAADSPGHFLARIEQHYAAQFDRIEGLYREHLAEKDGRLADKDALIEELRRRAEVAEARMAELEQGAAEPLARAPRPWWRFWSS